MSLTAIPPLVIDSDILIVKGEVTDDCNITEMFIQQEPVAANYTFGPVPNGDNYTWILNTQTPGSYEIRATTPVEDFEGCGGNNDTDTITIEVTEPVVIPIAQTQVLGETDPVNVDCDMVGIEITATQLMKSINGVDLPSPSLTATVNKLRNESFPVIIVADDTQYGENSQTNTEIVDYMPSVYASGNYLDVTVTLGVVPNLYQYDFGEGYQGLNKYHYTTAGLKTIYVKDTYGCIKTIFYQSNLLPVIDPTLYPSLFYISKGNSFRFVDRTDPDFDSCYNYKTDENTFDCDLENLDIDYFYTQKFKRCQDIPTQFKSSFTSFVASLYNAETNEYIQDLPVLLVQENLELESQLPYLRVDDPSFSYIYFANGEIPYYYQVGGTLTVNGEARTIQAFEYVQNLDVQAVQLQLLTVAEGGTADYIYNRQPYNVYEFLCPLTLLASNIYYMTIVATTDTLEETYVTPVFEVANEWKNHVDIFYYSDSNTDIYYGGDVPMRNQITIGIQSRAPAVQLELEVVNGDLVNFLKSSFNMEKFSFTFEPLTLEIMRKLVYSLANDRLFINSTGYACESVEIEVPNPETNLYVITALVYKANKNVKFISDGDTQFDFSSGIVTFDSGDITWDRTTY